MNATDYFRSAIKQGLHKQRNWVISAFSVVQESATDWQRNPFEGRLVRQPTGVFFVTPDKTLELIEGSKPAEPLLRFLDGIEMKAGEVPNLAQDVLTTVGNVIFNLCTLIYAFGEKVPFVTGKVDVRALENQIAARMESTPASSEERNPKVLYVDEYLKFVDSFGYLTEFTQLCVVALTKRIVLPPPGVKEFKAKLLEANKDNLKDATTLARIDAELVKFDAQYLKGDAGENFLISGKSRNIVRKRMFLIYGAETGLSKKMEMDLLKNSLSEGWEKEKLPVMINTFRAGSYDRGSETQLGGEETKWLLRASSNVRTLAGDCGTPLGRGIIVAQNNVHQLINRSIVTTKGPLMISTKEEAGAYLGKKLMVRSPMYCRYKLTDYCGTCMGANLASNKDGASMAITAYGSAFMLASLASFHAKQLKISRMDLKNALT